MTFEIGLLLVVVALALVFLSLEWIPADVVALGLLLTLILAGLLPLSEAFAGFGSDTVIMILGLLIMTTALLETGVVDLVGRGILRRAGASPQMLMLVIMIAVTTLSAFMSNTAAAAFFVPVVMGLAAKAGVAPSRLLLPVAFAAILSSSVTLISTSTNLVISGLMTNSKLAPMGMFELTPVGIPITLVGLLYMFFVGRHLLPERAAAGSQLLEGFDVRSYLTEVLVLPTSSLVGKTLAESGLGQELDLTVLRIVRDKDQYLVPSARMKLQAGDVLLVEGQREEILKVKDTAGIEIRPDVQLSDPNLASEDTALVEALVVPGSPLIGRNLRILRLRERHGLQVLGLNRHGKNLIRKLSRITLRVGDVLLLQGHRTVMAALADERVISILGAVEEKRLDRGKAVRSVIIFSGALALATFSVVSLPLAMLLGAFAVFVTRCITPANAYREVEWRVIILVACLLGLGRAMESSGTAKYLAALLEQFSGDVNPLWLLSGFFVLTVLLTQPMSNQAAAAVILPIAVQTAIQCELNPRSFAMMIAVAASCSYLTPLEPACLLVYGPGRYRFMDFFRVGGPLTALVFVVAILLVPRVWPLKPATPPVPERGLSVGSGVG